MAMVWFRKASEQGHPHSAYNLAVGHFTGIKTGNMGWGPGGDSLKNKVLELQRQAIKVRVLKYLGKFSSYYCAL